MPRSSSGLGRRPLTPVTRVQIPYGVQRPPAFKLEDFSYPGKCLFLAPAWGATTAQIKLVITYPQTIWLVRAVSSVLPMKPGLRPPRSCAKPFLSCMCRHRMQVQQKTNRKESGWQKAKRTTAKAHSPKVQPGSNAIIHNFLPTNVCTKYRSLQHMHFDAQRHPESY